MKYIAHFKGLLAMWHIFVSQLPNGDDEHTATPQ